MNKLLASALLAASLLAGPAAADPAYSVVGSIRGPDDGNYDYVSVDTKARTVFVARTKGVMTINLDTLAVTPVLNPGHGVAAVLVIPGTELMLSTNSRSTGATLFNRRTGKTVATFPTGEGPDGALFDKGLVYVMNGDSQDITILDLARRKVMATVPAGGTPEAAVSDGKGRIYINIEDTAEILVLDARTHTVAGRYALPGCEEPTGIAFDPRSGVLISACHNGVAKLIDHKTGKDLGSVAIGKDADGAVFDATRRLVFDPDAFGCATASAAVLASAMAWLKATRASSVRPSCFRSAPFTPKKWK
jgi:YVTN family beta-propeller protein